MRLFLFLVTWLGPALAASPADLRFVPGRSEEYRFDTGTLQGVLRADGRSLGLSELTHLPSGTRLDRAPYGIFSHYRVFTTHRRYGPGAWEWPSQSRRLADGGVQVHWAAADDHPFDLLAIYRWRAPNTLDLETRVEAHRDLPAFESFLASYFTADFPASTVYARQQVGTDEHVAFLDTDEMFGLWQMFPRDRRVVDLIQDGRWECPPHPVAWTIRPDMALPIGIRRHSHSGLTVILMAPSPECFAMSTPFAGEGHYSLYLSLFGCSVQAGQTASARARLVVAEAPTQAQILSLYASYMKDLSTAPVDAEPGKKPSGPP